MDNLDNLLKTAADDWRDRSKKPMRRSALAFIALGSGSVLTGGRLPAMLGTAVIGAVAVATWYLWPSSTTNTVVGSPSAPVATNRTVESPTLAKPEALAVVTQQGSSAQPSQQQRLVAQPSVATTSPSSSENLSSPIFPSERPRLSAKDLAEERRLRESFRQAAVLAETDPVASVALFMSVARAYEARKSYNHARYALLQARDLAATGAGDSEQVRIIEETLQRLQR